MTYATEECLALFLLVEDSYEIISLAVDDIQVALGSEPVLDRHHSARSTSNSNYAGVALSLIGLHRFDWSGRLIS